MKKLLFVFLSVLTASTLFAQDDGLLEGEWKCYLSDSTTFEYLKLNQDGSGIKAIGKTINGQDTILSDEKAYFQITNWKREKNTLIIETEHSLKYFSPDTHYYIQDETESEITLFGDHLELGIYPSHLNKELFRRTVTYTKTKFIEGSFGVKTDSCIFGLDLFDFEQIDSSFHKANYVGFSDLIPHLVGCTFAVNFVKDYADPAYELTLPIDFDSWSLSYRTEGFCISFKDKSDTVSGTSISIFYDFTDSQKDYYFSEVAKGNKVESVIQFSDLDLHLYQSYNKKHAGKTFYDNHIFVYYFTEDKSKEQFLQGCITSFKYKE